MKLSIIESEYQKALLLGGSKLLKINYSSKFYVIKVLESKFEVENHRNIPTIWFQHIIILFNFLNYMQTINKFWMNFILFAPFKSQVLSYNSVQLFQIVGIFLQFGPIHIFQIVGIFLRFDSNIL